jgi:cobalamin biosynthesis protein CobD/CbiB
MDSTEIIGAVTALLLISIVMGFALYVAIVQYVPVWLASLIAVAFIFMIFLTAVARIVYLLRS